MAWIYLIVAGILEIGWAVGMKYTDGFTRPFPTVVTAITMLLSVGFLSQAVRTIPLGTAYAIWTGIGVIGTVTLGIILFKEPAYPARMIFLGLIVVGIIGLKLS